MNAGGGSPMGLLSTAGKLLFGNGGGGLASPPASLFGAAARVQLGEDIQARSNRRGRFEPPPSGRSFPLEE